MTGLTGTGKTSYARSVVQKAAAVKPVPDDIIYVYNFSRPESRGNQSAGRKGHEFSKTWRSL